ncbi:alpha/beta fold hydrolase [Streptomyces sp. YC537]|uniref:Alpha/beta fold hydrolase n=1 Tax=Streptomyces boluensis TaxID=1775135 RepID=A0A964UZU7_9ACTN|nr:alpha/beta fold hydrolase [Streptomyces boluensis]
MRRTAPETVEVGGIRLAFTTVGPPTGEPVVLLHALGESATDWDTVAADLATHERRVYALDLRGHGRSDRPKEYSLELMRTDVLGFLDARGLTAVDLIGHSLGGIVAHLLAQHSPHRVRRLILEDVPAPRPREPHVPPRPPGPLDFDWDMVLAVREQLDTPDPAWLDGLAGITARTLVVSGGPDSPMPPDAVAELAHRIPGARHVTIPAGHLIHRTAPDEFIDTVIGFLDGALDEDPVQ